MSWGKEVTGEWYAPIEKIDFPKGGTFELSVSGIGHFRYSGDESYDIRDHSLVIEISDPNTFDTSDIQFKTNKSDPRIGVILGDEYRSWVESKPVGQHEDDSQMNIRIFAPIIAIFSVVLAIVAYRYVMREDTTVQPDKIHKWTRM